MQRNKDSTPPPPPPVVLGMSDTALSALLRCLKPLCQEPQEQQCPEQNQQWRLGSQAGIQ